MNTIKTWHARSASAKATEQIGMDIGSKLHGGEVIELVSDLGGGKTTFVRGLARGAGSKDTVGSPTFTLSREYVASSFMIAHFDFYRLGEAGIVADELAEVVGDEQYVTVVEWGEIVHDVLPAERLTVNIGLDAIDEQARDITITYPESYSYVIRGLA